MAVLAAGCAAPPPAPARAMHREAVARYSRGETEQSLALLAQALERDPEHLESYQFRALVRAAQGRFEEALADLDQVLRRSADDRDALSNAALVLSDLGRHEAALVRADRLVALEPSSSDARLLRGYVQARGGRVAEAHADYEEARKRGAGRWQWYYSAGVRELDWGRFPSAERYFEFASALAPEHPDPHIALGRVHGEMRRYDRAIAAYSRALDFRPADADVLYMRGLVLLAVRRASEAVADFDASIALKKTPLTHVARGLARRATANVEGAEADFTEAIRLDPGCRDAFRYRAQLRYDLGVLGDAERDYVAALAIAATASDVRGLARIYVDKEELEKAVRLYEQALKLPSDADMRERLTSELAELRKRTRKE